MSKNIVTTEGSISSRAYIRACAAKWGIDPALIREVRIIADASCYGVEMLRVELVLDGTRDLLPEVPE